MVEEKIGRRALLKYAIYGIDTAIIASAKALERDREGNRDEALEIIRLSDIRKLIGAELRAMDNEEQEELVNLHGVAVPLHIAQEIADMKQRNLQMGQRIFR